MGVSVVTGQRPPEPRPRQLLMLPDSEEAGVLQEQGGDRTRTAGPGWPQGHPAPRGAFLAVMARGVPREALVSGW